ncbi:ADP-ribosylation factor-binding protein GGA, partial [Tremellales sp. Uapishka_1]
MLPLGAARPWASISPIQALVERACDATLLEPNYPVNVELSEYINRKKANSAREATHALLPLINSRNPGQSLLALHLLDHLVHSCGYPMHLQISTKEFLNELVRRFPERPPMVTGRVMGKILELIHEWKNTLCVHSKYKEDLVHIRDMHRLLSFKGYRFKAFDATRAMASANPNANLKSPEELEEEDRAAKSAKLQELIRRGTPRDLAAAQELMKALSGAEPEKQPDYASQTLSELDKVQAKAILLNDMLNNAHEGEKVGITGDAYDQVANACKGARPKIQKWVEEDTGEREGMMDRLLMCNDLINTALERFEACKAGDWVKAQAIVNDNNPNQKAADLISFDAFADEAPMSGDGGLSLPMDGASSSLSTATNVGLTSSGLPLDLFSAPSPSPSPLPSSSSSGGMRQNPMDFFKTSTSPLQPQQSTFGQPQQSTFEGPGGRGGFGGGIGGSTTTSQPPTGYSLSPQPSAQFPQPIRPSHAIQPPTSRQQQQVPPPPKKDAFADLVNLMD